MEAHDASPHLRWRPGPPAEYTSIQVATWQSRGPSPSVAPVTASYTIVTRPGTIRRGSVSVCHVLLETIHWSYSAPRYQGLGTTLLASSIQRDSPTPPSLRSVRRETLCLSEYRSAQLRSTRYPAYFLRCNPVRLTAFLGSFAEGANDTPHCTEDLD
jgi:hypothetical protein